MGLMLCLADFEGFARKSLGRNAWDYYFSGSNHEQTLRDNKEAFSRYGFCVQYRSSTSAVFSLIASLNNMRRYRFRPRVLRDVSNVDMRVQLFGEWVEFPILVAPSAMHKMSHHEGELATARGEYIRLRCCACFNCLFLACAELKTCMALSVWSTTALEEVAEANGSGLRWFQLYVFKDKEITRQFIERAEKQIKPY